MRRALLALAVVVAVVGAARIALGVWVEHETREALDGCDAVHLSVLRGTYVVDGLKLLRPHTPARDARERPFFFVPHLTVVLDPFASLARRAWVVRVEAEHPKLTIIDGYPSSGPPPPLRDPELELRLGRLPRALVTRVAVRDGEITHVTKHAEPLWFHGIDATLEQLATRAELQDQPTTVAASGTLADSAQLSLFATGNPHAQRLTLEGRATGRGLELTDLARLLASEADVAPTSGTADLLASFHVGDGRIVMRLLPSVRDASFAPGKKDVGAALKAWFATIKVAVETHTHEHGAVATIPLRGRAGPHPELWKTLWDMFKEAFLSGMQSDPLPAARAGPPPRRAPQKR